MDADAPVNVQDDNVGNVGDVAKHVALVALADLLRSRNAGPVRHVETHAYRLTGSARAAIEGGSARWRALQAPWAARGRYRCSAGLAYDALGPETRLVLSEIHGETRAALRGDLEQEGIVAEAVLDDLRGLLRVPLLPRLPTLLHVDPFDHPSQCWDVVQHVVAAAGPEARDVAVLVFAHDRKGPLAWPPAPPGLSPVGRWDAVPYALAAWASPDLVRAAVDALAAFSWKPAVG